MSKLGWYSSEFGQVDFAILGPIIPTTLKFCRVTRDSLVKNRGVCYADFCAGAEYEIVESRECFERVSSTYVQVGVMSNLRNRFSYEGSALAINRSHL